MPITDEEREYLKFLGKNIIKIRKKNNLKQEGLSDILDIDDSSLRRIESGRTNPTTIPKLALVCNECHYYYKKPVSSICNIVWSP